MTDKEMDRLIIFFFALAFVMLSIVPVLSDIYTAYQINRIHPALVNVILTGKPHEWVVVGEGEYQCTRCGIKLKRNGKNIDVKTCRKDD